jgi:excisionase family DNA binding protein
MSDGKLVPLRQAAAVFFPHGGVTKSTLQNAIARGQLSYVRIGNKFFVSETDIAQWLEKCRVPAKEQVSSISNSGGKSQSMSSVNQERGAIALASLEMKLKKLLVRSGS